MYEGLWARESVLVKLWVLKWGHYFDKQLGIIVTMMICISWTFLMLMWKRPVWSKLTRPKLSPSKTLEFSSLVASPAVFGFLGWGRKPNRTPLNACGANQHYWRWWIVFVFFTFLILHHWIWRHNWFWCEGKKDQNSIKIGHTRVSSEF